MTETEPVQEIVQEQVTTEEAQPAEDTPTPVAESAENEAGGG